MGYDHITVAHRVAIRISGARANFTNLTAQRPKLRAAHNIGGYGGVGQ